MKEFKEVLDDFEKYLPELTNQLVTDLRDILSQKSIVYKEGKTELDIVGYFFEYEYEWLDIIFYGLDKKNELSTETIKLPTKLIEKSCPHSVTPLKMNVFEINIEDEYDEDKYSEDEFYELYDKYHQEKFKIFEKWFCDCWIQATENTDLKTNSYFSVHDTFYRTDLKTMKQINQDEIEKRYE